MKTDKTIVLVLEVKSPKELAIFKKAASVLITWPDCHKLNPQENRYSVMFRTILTVIHSQGCRADSFAKFIHSVAFVCVRFSRSHFVNLEIQIRGGKSKLTDAQIEFTKQKATYFLTVYEIMKSLTSNMCSPVDSSYLLRNLSLFESSPLVRFHDTSGFGSPFTVALKTAIFPSGCTKTFHLDF